MTDWTADERDQHGAIHRIYSTHYYDRISGAQLEVISVPAFVLPLTANNPSHRLSANVVGQLLALSSELLGGDGHLFQVVSNQKRSRGPAASLTRVSLEEHGLWAEPLSERVAFDLMLGRAEHQAFRGQLEASTIPVESSPPIMQAVVNIVQQAVVGVASGGAGGLVLTAAGAAVGLFARKTGRSVADEVAAIARRGVRSLTVEGRVQNENELLTLQAENLELKRKNRELQASLNAQQPGPLQKPEE